MLEKVGGNYFPYCVFIDPESGEVIAEVRPTSEVAFRAGLLEIQMNRDPNQEPNEAFNAAIEVLKAMRGSGQPKPLEELDKLVATEGFPAKVKELYDRYRAMRVVDDKIMSYLQKAQQAGSREEVEKIFSEGMYGLLKEGVKPVGDQFRNLFWLYALKGAVAAKDLDNAKIALAGVDEILKTIPEEHRGSAKEEIGYDDMVKKVKELETPKDGDK